MSFTRFHDDDLRISKQMEQMTFPGRYQLDVPGPGVSMPMQDDVHIRMDLWGANLRTNTVNLESDLLGITRPLNRDDVKLNNYENQVKSSAITYATNQPFVEESRASHPAWIYRDLEHPVWEKLIVDPQANLEKPFHDNIQTRILEKDYHKPQKTHVLRSNKTDPFSIEYYLSKN